MKILVADDDPIIRKLLSEVLTNDGHQVAITSNGREALEETRKLGFQLVFMDVHMPVMNGLEALLAMQELFPDLPVAMMDSYPDKLAFQAKREGALTCIHKPFDLKEIRKIIRDVENSVSHSKVI
jgi:two-component system response regulator (stage 0 sporulation protein F)